MVPFIEVLLGVERVFFIFDIKSRRLFYTVWKFIDFSVTQIVREISFDDFASLKTAVLKWRFFKT